MKLEVIAMVVHNSKAAYYSSLVQGHQANLQMSFPCKGTTHQLLGMLGMTDRPKTLIMSVVRADESAGLIEILQEHFHKGGDYKGVAFTVPLSSMIGTLAYGFLSNEKIVKEEV